MLRLLSIRNFAVVESLDAEFGAGFTVLTGETGAGKSILLDALSLLLGDRFDTRQLRPGADRAEIAAEFAVDEASSIGAWLLEQDLAAEGALLLRRVLDAQGRSRAWINGRPATLAQLTEAGERLIDLHGQHAHQSLGRAEMQRHLLDAFGGFATLAGEVASSWRAWRDVQERRARAARDAAAKEIEREGLARRHADLAALGATAQEWRDLSQQQSRLAHAAALLEAAGSAEAELAEGESALLPQLASLTQRLRQAATHDSALDEIVALIDEARIRFDEASRSLRSYRERLELDPAELERVERRLASIHEMARKYRVRPEELPDLAASTEAELKALVADTDVDSLVRAEHRTKAAFDALAQELSAKRKFAAAELGHRVTSMMAKLAMAGGRVEVGLTPLSEPSSYGLERAELKTATHPKQPLGPL